MSSTPLLDTPITPGIHSYAQKTPTTNSNIDKIFPRGGGDWRFRKKAGAWARLSLVIPLFHFGKFHHCRGGIKFSQGSKVNESLSKKYSKVVKTPILAKIFFQYLDYFPTFRVINWGRAGQAHSTPPFIPPSGVSTYPKVSLTLTGSCPSWIFFPLCKHLILKTFGIIYCLCALYELKLDTIQIWWYVDVEFPIKEKGWQGSRIWFPSIGWS